MTSMESYRDGSDQPTPDQLDRLVNISMGIARASGTVKASRRRKQSYIFLPPWIEQPLGNDDYCATIHHVAGRVNKVGHQAHKLWIREGLSFLEGEKRKVLGQHTFQKSEVNLSALEKGYLKVYYFAWTSRHVLDAVCLHRKIKRENELPILPSGQDIITPSAILVAEPAEVIDLEKKRLDVSQAGCDELIRQMRTYGEVVQRAA